MDNLSPIDWSFIVTRLSSFATSEISRAYLHQIKPVANIGAAVESLANIGDTREIVAKGFRPQVSSLDLFESWFQRLNKSATLKVLELRDVRTFSHEVLSTTSLLKDSNREWPKKMKAQLMDTQPIISAIDHMLTPEGEIRTDASETLYSLYQEKKQKAQQIQQTLDSLVKKYQMEPLLQDKYVTTREGRWVLPIKSGMQHSFSGVIHATSQTKQTVFMEPNDIVPLNNRLREVDDLIDKEIENLLRQLSEYLFSYTNDLGKCKNLLVEIDMCFAKAQLAEELNANNCSFSSDTIELYRLRHPLLVSKAALERKEVVANNVVLSQNQRILLLSGPNAGGKTVLLKSIGLAAQMARCGMPICAGPDSKVPFFKNVYVIVGDAQNVDLDLSTFAAHLKALNQACQAKSSDNLLLIDEICGSTDPEEGSALAKSFIERFSQQQVFAVITSHLSPLKLGWDKNSGVLNGSLESDIESGLPTYKFISGIAGQSMAIQTAKRVGVSQEIVERATALLSPTSQWHKRNMEEIQSIKERLLASRVEYEEGIKKANHLKNQYSQLVEKFRNERQAWMEKSLQKAEEKIDELIAKTKVAQTFERHEKLSTLKKEIPQVIGFSDVKSKGQATSAEDFAEKFPPGTRVLIKNIGRVGLVQSAPNKDGDVFLLSESMRISANWKQLEPVKDERPPGPTGFGSASTGGFKSTSLPSYLTDNEFVLDLRGKRVDEAIQDLEVALDEAATKQEDRLKVIHGHGTEALKRAIRTHLSRSPHVKSWKAGAAESGGDGITWVEFL